MRRRRDFMVLLTAGLVAGGPGLRGPEARPFALAKAVSGTVSVVLQAGDYALQTGADGETHIRMDKDFGFFGAPGEPELPARTFLIALPPGARVTGVQFETRHALGLADAYEIAPVGPAVTGPEDADRATARWEANREHAYATDHPYPGHVGIYMGQGQWRRYTYARVAFQPFSYRARSGWLRFHPELAVSIDYQLPQPRSAAWRQLERLRDDRVLDDLVVEQLVNVDQAQAWYDGLGAGPVPTANSLYDYVVVVQNDTMAETVASFKTWKESLGHSVRIVTLDWIHANYSGVDVAEEVWDFLHDKYPSGEWGIRYVLLVGDLQVIPTRRVYYNDTGWGLRSDHFFAKLSGGDTGEQVWNRDGDVRWGELDDDEMSVEPDVLVGRIPLNSTTDVSSAIDAMIAYEQDDGGWKHNALMAAGYATIHSASSKRDLAIMTEYIRENFMDPNGWTYTRLYEQTGLGTSTYTGTVDYDTRPANVVTAWNGEDHGLAILADHGNTGGLSGHIWQHDTLTVTGQVDPGEWVWSDLFGSGNVASLTNDHPAFVQLLGCNTLMLVTPPWPEPDQTMSDPGGYTANTGSQLLANGSAAGVVGFSSPGPTSSASWSHPDHGNYNTVGTYFAENLIQNHYTVGRSLYETKIRYTNKFWNNNYQPFHWSFHLFGDPSMILEGYDDSARDSNRQIHDGTVYAYGTDNADDGSMFVAVSTRPDTMDGEIKVYRSTNHGETWGGWATVGHGTGIRAVDVIVGQWEQDEMADDRVHVFFTDIEGNVWDARIDMANPTSRDDVLIASEGGGKRLPSISAARDPMPMPSAFNLYVTWDVDSGDSHTVKGALSTVNGTNWTNRFSYSGYQQPHIDAGPYGYSKYVYLVTVADSFPNHVHVNRSRDRGANWGTWENLTSGDSGDYHGAPVIASSTDGAFPTVWVAYNYYKTVVYGGADLRFAYSKDGGGSWTKNQTLSAEQGFDELMPDMVGHRTGPSRWMNIAYHHSQSSRTNVVWRWVSGSTPGNWWARRVVNDNDTHPAMGPQVIYSPGAAASGSGVVYPGTGAPVNDLYFAAPWLTPTAAATHLRASTQGNRQAHHAPEIPVSPRPSEPLEPGRRQATAETEQLSWAFTGALGDAFRVAGLARHPSGPFLAAATTSEVDEANTGTVFRSDDGGESWEPVPELPLAWWLDSILITDAGTLLVGGMMYDRGDQDAVAHAAIYRSDDLGEHWTVAGEWMGTGSVHALLQRRNGDVVAGTGPGGLTLVSQDDGQSWQPLITPPQAEHIHALAETSDGRLYAGGEQKGETGVVYCLVGEESWETVDVIDNPAAVYALLAGDDDLLYAGVAFSDGTGRVQRSFDGGDQWEPSAPLADCRAVRALLEGAAGTLYAGLDMGGAQFTSYVYVSEDHGASWHDAGYLFMADAVHDLLLTPEGSAYAASGDTYGVTFRTQLAAMPQYGVYLPLVVRDF